MAAHELGVVRGGDRACVLQADVAAADDAEAQRALRSRGRGDGGRADGRRRGGTQRRQRQGAPPPDALGARQARPVQIRRCEVASGEPRVQQADLARVRRRAGEVGRLDPAVRDGTEVLGRELCERVAAGPARLGAKRADVRADEPQPVALDLSQCRVARHAARRAQQHDGPSASRGADRGRHCVGSPVASMTTAALMPVACSTVTKRSAPGVQRGGLTVARRGDDGHRPGPVQLREPLRERADRAGADDAQRLARDRSRAAHAVARDDREVAERGVLHAHAVRHRGRPGGRDGHDRRVACASDGDEGAGPCWRAGRSHRWRGRPRRRPRAGPHARRAVVRVERPRDR